MGYDGPRARGVGWQGGDAEAAGCLCVIPTLFYFFFIHMFRFLFISFILFGSWVFGVHGIYDFVTGSRIITTLVVHTWSLVSIGIHAHGFKIFRAGRSLFLQLRPRYTHAESGLQDS